MTEPTTSPSCIQDWAAAYVCSTELAHKLDPPAPPRVWAEGRAPHRIPAPGRPPELDLIGKSRRSTPLARLANPRARARLVHAFLHHELQAAELLCWALLAFPDTPLAFRQGLWGICRDEIRHLQLYRAHLAHLGFPVGAFPVRDWFWQRITDCATPLQFVALLGIGFEGGNLDHMRRFQAGFAAAGDRDGAALLRIVGDEEVPHVRFALRWFRTWTGALEFDRWRETLVAPLTPALMKGPELDEERRTSAGFPVTFLAALRDWDG